MLQQTTVATVKAYYARFLEKYPTVDALAQAPRDDVLALWAGLGYYTRARNLHACARLLADQGAFPQTVDGLRALPGIGDYTARAIAAIAFGVPVIPVDGNVERIASRIFAIEEPLPQSRRQIAQRAATLNDGAQARARASDFAQALFDLGATICTPRNPACGLCPWREACAAHARGIAASLPRRARKQPKPERFGACFILRDASGAVWLRRRPETGLLAGMAEFPGTAWRETPWRPADAMRDAPMPVRFRELGIITHVFTHLTLRLTVFEGRTDRFAPDMAGFACPADNLAGQSLPTVMRKCLDLSQDSATLLETTR